jgi:putative nucleotidyltransferase with HDIG domain
MIAGVESLLRNLQSALSTRQLYPADHPRLSAIVQGIVEQARELTAMNGEIAVVWFDHRVTWNDMTLQGGEALARTLFATLSKEGFHRLTICHGLEAHEVSSLVSSLVDVGRNGETRTGLLQSSPGLRLSSLEATLSDASQKGGNKGLSKEERASLVHVWDDLLGHRRLNLDALDITVLALCRTLERDLGTLIPLASLRTHDEYTVNHIVNVALLAMALGEAVGLPSWLVRELGVAALLHDVGKLRIPTEILNGTGELTDEQRALIRRHPEDGARILLATKGASDLAVAVAYEHHLQYDRGGYPAVPKNWQINFASEITHVADVFDALRTRRSYRAAFPRDRIASMMTRDAGTVFDPVLIDTFFEIVIPRTVDLPPDEEDSVEVADRVARP